MQVFNKLRLTLSLIAFSLLFTAISCDEDPALPDNVVGFEATELGMDGSETELDITVRISRVLSADAIIVVGLTTDGITYGIDFTTDPAAVADQISVTIPKGSTEASFTIIKADDLVLDGDETIEFVITDAPSSLVIDASESLVVSFAEILSAGGSLEINGGGATYTNKVFIDLSANRQTAVNRGNWDLGLYAGDDFHVILNSSVAMLARQLDKNDLNTVTAADTVGFSAEMVLAEIQSMAWVDDPSGDLTKTAFAEVSATLAENKVYIINRGDGTNGTARGWKKIRVIRNGEGYSVQHADIAATTFTSVDIAKSETHLFSYIVFETGEIAIEPAKDKWDIAWTYFMNSAYFGPDPVPYMYQDFVISNRNGIEVSEVLTSSFSYDEFEADDLVGITFSSSQSAIGASWRNGGGPGSAPSLKTDRFYLIKDATGNYYKLKFTALLKDGVRGNPSFEYELL